MIYEMMKEMPPLINENDLHVSQVSSNTKCLTFLKGHIILQAVVVFSLSTNDLDLSERSHIFVGCCDRFNAYK